MGTPVSETENGAAAYGSLEILWKIASSCRRMHRSVLEAAFGDRSTEGSCLHASVLLASSVNRFSAWRGRVRGGNWISGSGVARGHYWVQANLYEAAYVLDITADQFGQAGVLVLPLAAALAWQPVEDTNVDEHIQELGLEVLTEKAPEIDSRLARPRTT